MIEFEIDFFIRVVKGGVYFHVKLVSLDLKL
jgi:hypothetical protein